MQAFSLFHKIRALCGPIVFALLVSPAISSSAFADVVQLTNGDAVSGTVVSMDAQNVVLKSEVLGELKIARAKVASIQLGDVKPPARPAVPQPMTNAPAVQPPAVQPQRAAARPGSPEDLIQQLTGRKVPVAGGPSPEDLVKQMQQGGGVSPQMLGGLQQSFPLLAAPEAQQYFNGTLSGLMTGKKNIQDVRKDAVQARNMILELKQELGQPGDALNGYLGILNNFIDETKPAGEPSKTVKPQPGSAAPKHPAAANPAKKTPVESKPKPPRFP